MKHLAIAAVLMALVGVASAAPHWQTIEARIPTNNPTTAVTGTASPEGYVDEIYIAIPASTTSRVTVVSAPAVATGLPGTVLYTNAAVTASGRVRTRVTQTDSAGSNLSSLTVAERFLCKGDTLTLRVEQASARTQVVFRAWIKMD